MNTARSLLALSIVSALATACSNDGSGDSTRAATIQAEACVDSVTTLPPAGILQHRNIVNARARNAVCNDGSDASYYIRQGTGCGVKRWIITLEGGGACREAGCPGRLPYLLTSTLDPVTTMDGGIISSDPNVNPDFFTSTQVFVHSCSSDFYTGDRAASDDTGGYEFRGNDIVKALLADLSDATITGTNNLATASEVLLVGDSAGGTGVYMNLDLVHDALPGRRVRGFSDAGWEVDIPIYGQAPYSTVDRASDSVILWNSHSDESCMAAETQIPGRCGVGATLQKYITTPYFVQQSQYDPTTLLGDGITVQPLDAGEQSYEDAWAADVRATLSELKNPILLDIVFSLQISGPPNGVYSSLVAHHTRAFDDQSFNEAVIGNESLRQALGNWYFARGEPTKLIEQP